MTDVRLLEAVVPNLPEGWYCVFGLKNGKFVSQNHFKTLEEVKVESDRLVGNGIDVFYACGRFITDESRDADNCGWMQSFFLDIDCGPDKAKPDQYGRIKGYIDQATGFDALKDLCKTLDLPRPSIVNSGRGWHVYWTLTEPVERDKWQPVANAFKALCLSHKFIVDPAVPADAARILRIPGTKNFKDRPAHDVTLMHLAPPISFDDFAAKLGPIAPVKPHTPTKELDDFTKAIIGNRQSRFKNILIKTKEGTGCAQLQNIVDNQETIEEPLWRAGLSIAQHCVDREIAIHAISDKHPKYDPGETERKAAKTKGPYTCDTFDSYAPNICQNCSHRGQIKSPIVLGHEIAKSNEGDEINYVATPQAAAISSTSTGFKVPKLPNKYFRGKNGGIYKNVKDEEAEDGGGMGVVLVYEYDLFVVKRLFDPLQGETVLIHLALPKDGVKEFSLSLVDALSKEELRKAVSFYGVIAMQTQMNLILEYLVQCAKELQVTQEAEMMRLQFGWADEDSKFILGDREIGPSFIRYSPPSKATREVAHALRPAGSLEDWKDIVNVYNMPGFEPHAFAVMTAFGAPLIKFMNIKGGIINLINNRSGTGKSTILQVMNSVWGHPDALMLQWRDTLNVKLHRMAVMCNLPIGVDEITKMSGDDFSDLAYSVTQGTPRRRMKASTNEERESQGFWATMMVSTSNSSMTDKLESLKSTSEGELMRLMQYRIDPTNNLDKATAKHIFGRLNSNHGVAGLPYAQYLVQHLEEVIDLAMKVQLRFDAATKIESKERFWSGMAAANLTGGMIASKLGLHNIDTKRVYDWAVNEVGNMQDATRLNFNDYATIVGEFLLKHTMNTLVVNRHSTSRSGIAASPLFSPKAGLMIRYEPDTKKIFIVRQALKDFCVSRQVTFMDLLEALNKTGAFIAEVRTRLDMGMEMTAPPVVALEFDADILGIEPPSDGDAN
jgi:hypothetical protein